MGGWKIGEHSPFWNFGWIEVGPLSDLKSTFPGFTWNHTKAMLFIWGSVYLSVPTATAVLHGQNIHTKERNKLEFVLSKLYTLGYVKLDHY